jgi:hypothetical protein
MTLNGMPAPIDAGLFKGARFIGGAHRIRMEDGGQLTGLTLQRRDLTAAIDILKSARITF